MPDEKLEALGRKYPVEIQDIYEGAIKVNVKKVGSARNQDQWFMVPKTHIPAYILDGILMRNEREHFFITTHSLTSTSTWVWDSTLDLVEVEKETLPTHDTLGSLRYDIQQVEAKIGEGLAYLAQTYGVAITEVYFYPEHLPRTGPVMYKVSLDMRFIERNNP